MLFVLWKRQNPWVVGNVHVRDLPYVFPHRLPVILYLWALPPYMQITPSPTHWIILWLTFLCFNGCYIPHGQTFRINFYHIYIPALSTLFIRCPFERDPNSFSHFSTNGGILGSVFSASILQICEIWCFGSTCGIHRRSNGRRSSSDLIGWGSVVTKCLKWKYRHSFNIINSLLCFNPCYENIFPLFIISSVHFCL